MRYLLRQRLRQRVQRERLALCQQRQRGLADGIGNLGLGQVGAQGGLPVDRPLQLIFHSSLFIHLTGSH